MKRLARMLPVLALLLLGACATNIRDLRLESVSPIAERELPPVGLIGYEIRRSGGVVAEFSSARDLRRQIARFDGSFFAVVERCAGRTHIEDPPMAASWISHGEFMDEHGLLAQAGSIRLNNSADRAPAEGVPRNGRFFFLLPIHLEGYVTERPTSISGLVARRVFEQDLLRAPDDLCVFARGFAYFQGIWRSNTVVIPYAAIRAALDSAPSP
jgi:hypothetical protein